MGTKTAYYDVDPRGSGRYGAILTELRPWKNKRAAILDSTVFYPKGGGQPGDRGTINGIPVLDVREEDGVIFHILDEASGAGEAADGPAASGGKTAGPPELGPGPVELALDLIRRRDFTIQHSAQHLLSGTMLRLTGFPTVSMHLGETYNTIDVDGPVPGAAVLAGVEEEVMDAIEADRPVIIHLCPPERLEDFPLRKIPPRDREVIRVVEIEGCDFSPCCGTHAASAGAIGMVRIVGAEKYKAMTRISFIAGRRCFADSRMLRENAVRVSRALKVPVEETGRAVEALLEKYGALEERLGGIEEDAARREAEALIGRASSDSDSAGLRFYGERFASKTMEELLRIGRQAQKRTAAALVLGSERELKFAALCSAKGTDLRPDIKRALDAAGGRGGGGPGFFQGQFDSAEMFRAFFDALGTIPGAVVHGPSL
ncbi:MAG: alanyl-tRNA editing protein [Treponema sp.]|jgi:alanyl-tRNA synthetase|nr:alanyl-tRNA editing protein [Treponema sp.]